jgi:transglutaminase-like putative cysteine protease
MTRRAQLSAEELQQLKWLLGSVLTLLGVSTIVYMDIEAWSLMALNAAAAVAVLVRPTLPARVPRLAHVLAFPVIVAFFAGDLWLRTEVLPAMVRLGLLLLLYRTISYRQRRDDLQIVILGLFLIIVAGVLTVSLTFAVHLLVYTGAALALLLTVTLCDGSAGRQVFAPPVPGEVPAWAAHVRWGHLARRLREVTDWRIVGLGAVLFAGVVAVSAVLFLAIPRFQIENSMFLDRFITKKAKSGFSDSIRFGDVTEIQQDFTVALSVDVSDQARVPASPYWRMVVLDQYMNGQFRMSAALRRQEFGPERTHPFLHGEAKPRQGTAVFWTFYLESGVSRYLPLAGQFELLLFREAQNFRHARNLALVALREEPVAMTAYRVEGFDPGPLLPDPAFAARWRRRDESGDSPHALQTGVSLPTDGDHRALERIVTELRRGQEIGAEEFARRARDWLRAQHQYSLAPTIPRGEGDPLVRWLVSREAGHCELFAGSLVLLARKAGFPARVVTGFRGGSWNGFSNNFSVRNSDAHAWTEIFDEEKAAWLRADALETPAAAQAAGATGDVAVASRLDRSWKARIDSLRVFWYRRIVSFDQRSQAEALKAVKAATEQSGKRLRERLEAMGTAVRQWFTTPWDVERAFKTLAFLVMAGGALWWLATQGRAVLRELARALRRSGGDPVRREAGRLLVTWEALRAKGRSGGAGAGAEEGETERQRDGEREQSGDGATAGRGAGAPGAARAGGAETEEERAARGALERVRYGRPTDGAEAERVFRRARQAMRAARRR